MKIHVKVMTEQEASERSTAPGQSVLEAETGTNLLALLREHHLAPDAPCGGQGKCGKCLVWIEGKKVRACQFTLTHDVTVHVPQSETPVVMTGGVDRESDFAPVSGGWQVAVDIGTTTVVCYLLSEKDGAIIDKTGRKNPQRVFGADVISRIQAAQKGKMEELTELIQCCLTEMILEMCRHEQIRPDQISVISVAGNPCMEQLFLGIRPDNLAAIPFAPAITEAKVLPASRYLKKFRNAELLVIPDISGYVGGDTVSCILATDMEEARKPVLMVDIGTNGEMVLGCADAMTACSTAAGPALEGASICQGMSGEKGAIDHVWEENGQIRYSVIGGGQKADGICGSGLIDAVAVLKDLGIINSRGRICPEYESAGMRKVPISPDVSLTQDDIRQVQMAKGAICSGIRLMAENMCLAMEDISAVYLAGAFGNYMKPESACRIGLLPAELLGRVIPVGNAAGTGARMAARNRRMFYHTQEITEKVHFLELASLPQFQHTFAENMRI